MPKYRVTYKTYRMIHDGAWMDDPEPVYDNESFDAENDIEAFKIAEELLPRVSKRYLGPRTTLESVVELKPEMKQTWVDSRKVERPQKGAQLKLPL